MRSPLGVLGAHPRTHPKRRLPCILSTIQALAVHEHHVFIFQATHALLVGDLECGFLLDALVAVKFSVGFG